MKGVRAHEVDAPVNAEQGPFLLPVPKRRDLLLHVAEDARAPSLERHGDIAGVALAAVLVVPGYSDLR